MVACSNNDVRFRVEKLDKRNGEPEYYNLYMTKNDKEALIYESGWDTLTIDTIINYNSNRKLCIINKGNYMQEFVNSYLIYDIENNKLYESEPNSGFAFIKSNEDMDKVFEISKEVKIGDG